MGHTKYVLSIVFSIDNCQIIPASRDCTVKLWNTLGDCKYNITDDDAHNNWAGCAGFNCNVLQPTICSSGGKYDDYKYM